MIFDPPDCEHFQREYRACDRCPEHRAEPCGDAGHQQDARAVRIEPQHAAETTGETAAKLDGGAFSTGRPTEQMRDNRADEDQRRHAQRHAAARFVDLLDDEIVAALNRAPGQMIEQADREPADRQEVQ